MDVKIVVNYCAFDIREKAVPSYFYVTQIR